MKIVLASYFQPQFHGKGRKIGITQSPPPNLKSLHGYECTDRYEAISPEQLYWDYHLAKKQAGDDEEKLQAAGQAFRQGYEARLEEFVAAVLEEVEKSKTKDNKKGKTVFEIVGLSEGDTLLSWELKGHLTFRDTAAVYLRKLGYEVEEN